MQGRVWFVAPPTAILTLPDGQNKQYPVRAEDNVQFIVQGRPATIFDLRTGMNVTAEKIVEEPDVEIATESKVVSQAPQPPSPVAAQPEPAAPSAAIDSRTRPASQRRIASSRSRRA